jgi:hypothetical protein
MREGRGPEFYREEGVTGDLFASCVLEASSFKLLSTLRRNTRIASLVQKVHCMNGGTTLEVKTGGFETQSAELLGELFRLFPSVKVFVMEDLIFSWTVDLFINQYQRDQEAIGGGGRNPLAFHGVVPSKNSFPFVRLLFGKYEGFEYHRVDPWIVSTTLDLSKDTLQSLLLPLSSFVNLVDFPRLERLCLLLTRDNRLAPRNNFKGILSPLAALKVLVFRRESETSAEFASPPNLSESLPPILTHLSVDFHFDPSQLFNFAQDLPEASKIERINIGKQRFGEEDRNAIKAAFASRSIAASFDEEWRIW